MALSFHFFFLLLRVATAAAGPIYTEFIRPNFTASDRHYVDTSGVFLVSPNNTFHAAVVNPGNQQSSFYFAVVHVSTNRIVWLANRDSAVTDSGLIKLTPAGLSVSRSDGSVIWSTPSLTAKVYLLRLLDSGNLLLLDSSNKTLWQSFDYPTDTLLSGQRLNIGATLTSAASSTNLSAGNYAFSVTAGDAVLRWRNNAQDYWRLSADVRFIQDYNADISYMLVNDSGLYFLTSDGQRAVFASTAATIPVAKLRIVHLDSNGRLHVTSYSTADGSSEGDEFLAPNSDCDLPFACESLSVCNVGSNKASCNCPINFGVSSSGGCAPANGFELASVAATCSVSAASPPTYLTLGTGVGYFGTKFGKPVITGGDWAACRDKCDGNCSCLGFFYRNSTGSCFLLENSLGSLYASSSSDAANTMGYVKAIASTGEEPKQSDQSPSTNLAVILLPITAFLLITVLAIAGAVWWRRKRRGGLIRKYNYKTTSAKEVHLGRMNSSTAKYSDGDDFDYDEIAIPGLPMRFTYVELEEATAGFQTRIGSGGFGEVYKGVLPDKTEVAVKKLGSSVSGGTQGRREFFTEIAVIGSVHHVNLVRLRGFCAQGSRCLLVYEYMNRGSLDRSLFSANSPPLEWGERIEIALGAARGLAYLHFGCDNKIIHCDVKPENILLHDGGHVKLSDFGLAKLLTPEQSGLFTTMRGTRGYLAPEWLTNSAISDRTDVYSYGMVLLEIVRGRKNRSGVNPGDDSELRTSGGGSSAASSSSSGGGYFPMVALEMHERKQYAELADRRLEGRVSEGEVERAVKIALCCLHEEPALRPSMAAVVGMLEGSAAVWEPRVESLGFLRLYGRGFAPRISADSPFPYYGGNLTGGTSSTTSGVSASYLSSHQLSGPR